MAEYTIPKPYRDFYVTDPYVATQKEVEELQEYSFPRSQVEYGSILHGENTLPDKEISVKVESKNLITLPYRDGEIRTAEGVTFSVSQDGGIALSGTPTGAATYTIGQYEVDPKSIYSFSISGTYTNIVMYVDLFDQSNTVIKTYGGESLTIDFSIFPTVRYARVWIITQNNDVECTGTVYPQLEKGDTATSYSLYQPEGTPVTVTTCGRNLCDIPETFTWTNQKTIWTTLKKGVYTISHSSFSTNGENGIRVYFFDKDKISLGYANLTSGQPSVISLNDTCSYLYLYSNGTAAASVDITATINHFMIESGNKSHSYKPYKSNTIQTTIGNTITVKQNESTTYVFADDEKISLSAHFILYTEELINDKLTAIIGNFSERPMDTKNYARLYIATDKTDTSRSTILPAGKSGATASNWIYI